MLGNLLYSGVLMEGSFNNYTFVFYFFFYFKEIFKYAWPIRGLFGLF